MGHLSTTANGMWVLQVLTGVEVMPVALRLRPYVPSADAGATVHTEWGPMPIEQTAEYASLVHAGIIDAATGAVDDAVTDWMTVLGQAQRHIILTIRQPAPDATGGEVLERHLVVVQHDRWLVMAARYGDEVVLSPLGDSPDPATQQQLIIDTLIHAMGSAAPATIEGLNIPTTALQDTLRATYEMDRATMVSALRVLGLTPEQVDVVAAAVRTDESAMAVVSVVDLGATVEVHPQTVTVVDTAHGRVSVSYTTGGDGTGWTSIWPGNESVLRDDLARLIGTPAHA